MRIKSFKTTAKTNHKCGGLRNGAGHGKHGWYKGYWCDSSWELAWVIYSLEHNVSFKRNKVGFPYIFDGKMHKYYPDFILADGTYIEIKGFQYPNWKAKLEQVAIPLKVYFKTDLKDVFEYVKAKYGDNFTYLYDKQ